MLKNSLLPKDLLSTIQAWEVKYPINPETQKPWMLASVLRHLIWGLRNKEESAQDLYKMLVASEYISQGTITPQRGTPKGVKKPHKNKRKPRLGNIDSLS